MEIHKEKNSLIMTNNILLLILLYPKERLRFFMKKIKIRDLESFFLDDVLKAIKDKKKKKKKKEYLTH